MHLSDRLLANALADALRQASKTNPTCRYDIRAVHQQHNRRTYSEVVICGNWGASQAIGDDSDYELRIAVTDGTLSFSMCAQGGGELSFFPRGIADLGLGDLASLDALRQFLANPLPYFLKPAAGRRLRGGRFGLDLPTDWWDTEQRRT
jgi:hypothetical protein